MKYISHTSARYFALVTFVAVGALDSLLASSHPLITTTVKQWQPNPNYPAMVAFNRDGSRLAVSNVLSKDIRIYSAPGFELFRIMGKPGEVRSIAFAPDGKTLAAGSGFSRLVESRNSIRLWDTDTGQVLWEPPGLVAGTGAENDVQALAFAPGGKVLLVSLESVHGQKTCCHQFLIDLQTKTMRGFDSSFSYSVAYSPNGDRIASGGFGWLRIWSATGEGPIWEQSIKDEDHPSNLATVKMVSFSPDGYELLISSLGGIAIRSAVDGHRVDVLPIERQNVMLASYSPDGQYIVVASGRRLLIFDARSKRMLEESELPKEAISISFESSGRKFAIGTYSGYVVIKEFVSK